MYKIVNYKITKIIHTDYPAQGSEPEPLHVEQENIIFAHDCALHWLHRQGITFFHKSLLHKSIEYWAYKIAAVHIVHTIFSHD